MENSKSVAFLRALDVAPANEVKRKRGSAVNKIEEQIFIRIVYQVVEAGLGDGTEQS